VFRIVDTTLRDGEQKCGIALSMEDKLRMATEIDSLGIYQIEAGIPAMGGEEKESIYKMMGLNLNSKVSAWNRLRVEDIKHSIDCRVHMIHIAVPVSEIQINTKLRKDKNWIINNAISCIYYARSNGYEVSVGFEDSTRAEIPFLEKLLHFCQKEGAARIRLADTVGILSPMKTYELVKKIKSLSPLPIEIHSHDDFGLALANSLAAIKAGAEYVDCTLDGIGERAGNCNYYKFMEVINKFRIEN
jgi:homocitrate synthase NifV